MPPEDQQSQRESPSAEVTAATEIALELGFPALTQDALAAKLNVSAAELIETVPSFDHLIELTIDHVGGLAFKQLGQTRMPAMTPENANDRMVESISMYLAVVRSNPAVWRLALMTPEGTPERLRERIEAGRMDWHLQMVEAVAPMLPESVDADLTAWALSALADNYARLVLIDPDHNAPSRLLEHARVMVSGVLGEIQSAAESN